MSSLVHSVVSEMVSHQRLQQPQQQQISATEVPLDSNNNAGCTFPAEESKQKSGGSSSFKASGSGEKYSLRPRSLQRRSESEESEHAGVSSSRSGSRRGVASSGSSGRPKQKPPPLSKYRRKTANARERDRMREINAAFETLRRAVPHISHAPHHSQQENSGEKLTKITTLRLAMKYIAALSQALQQADALVPDSSSPTSLHLMSDAETLAFREHSLTPPDMRHALTPADFRQSLTPSGISRLPPVDHRVPPLENRRQCLNPSDLNRRTLGSSPLSNLPQKCVIPSNQSILSPELRSPLPTSPDLCIPSRQSHPATNLGSHCLLNPGIEQGSVMSRPCLQPALNQPCLTAVDFEAAPPEDPSALLVFDDDSLESPDLDHLLIS